MKKIQFVQNHGKFTQLFFYLLLARISFNWCKFEYWQITVVIKLQNIILDWEIWNYILKLRYRLGTTELVSAFFLHGKTDFFAFQWTVLMYNTISLNKLSLISLGKESKSLCSSFWCYLIGILEFIYNTGKYYICFSDTNNIEFVWQNHDNALISLF